MTRWSKVKVAKGFDWKRVVWGLPSAVRTSACSYCREPLAAGATPLILTTRYGAVAEFCEQCKTKWFGAETLESAEN